MSDYMKDMRGFTVIELLITATIFLIVLGALGSLLVSSTRAYGVNAVRSEALQDSEAVLQLLRYEIALAGYRGLGAETFDQEFTFGSTETIAVNRTDTGDEVTVRYFEDRFLNPAETDDSGERSVTFRVNSASQTLERIERRPDNVVGTSELLVGSVLSMEVLALVAPNRDQVTIAGALDNPISRPAQLAGLYFSIEFSDESEWQFLIGLPNPQQYSVTETGTP